MMAMSPRSAWPPRPGRSGRNKGTLRLPVTRDSVRPGRSGRGGGLRVGPVPGVAAATVTVTVTVTAATGGR